MDCFKDDLRIDFGSFKHFADIVIWKLDFLNFLGFIQLGICQLSIQDVKEHVFCVMTYLNERLDVK